ncbi:hypothetical protein ACEPAF_3010 [Sanghuangporus sanghuang]
MSFSPFVHGTKIETKSGMDQSHTARDSRWARWVGFWRDMPRNRSATKVVSCACMQRQVPRRFPPTSRKHETLNKPVLTGIDTAARGAWAAVILRVCKATTLTLTTSPNAIHRPAPLPDFDELKSRDQLL